ncbi:uncharacterized protein N7515_007921 [Penicillium bovifimosum]|uniref:Apple domain-containing protein n=1 Tax=Penicillium bovifimosum TaxID=126998 RepID=A0A9W9GM34_9EURO|nr:uncharacterized protein N7515_007921 [Penicillium bovifimosum]KAJ5124096.1 hypothetical protein N7515_007921 [Penicillium bovifimosum]
MVRKTTLLLLGAISVYAQQNPLGDTNSCLSSPDPAACCASGQSEGEETVGDTPFQYVCGAIPSPSKSKGHNAATAYECAELCANDESCFAASWRTSGSSSRGNCFFALGDSFETKDNSDFMLLAKAPEPAPNPPCLDSPEANACCTGGQNEGEETVGDVVFKYTCGFVPTPSRFKGHSAASAYECAELCAQDDTCFGASWRIKGSSSRGNCFFAMSETFDQQANGDHMLLSKVVDSGDDNNCEKANKECLKQHEECETAKTQCVEEKEEQKAALQQCEVDKSRAENAESECIRNTDEITEKKRQCREEQQQCHEEKNQQAMQCQEDKAEQAIQYQQCQNQNNQLSLEIIKHQDEISDLQSTISTLQSSLNTLNSTYLALHMECKGGSGSGTCRSGIVNAEKRDDGCILPAGGKKFKIYYAKLDDPGSWDLGTPREPNFAACAARCARTARCVRFAWRTTNLEGTCWMRSHGQGLKPTKFSYWSSGHLV